MDDVSRNRILVGRPPNFKGDADMSRKRFVALSLVLASSAALAQQSLATVEVRAGSLADSERSMFITCSHTGKLNVNDVERVLQIRDSRQTPALSKKLAAAAAEGCKAGIPRILVTRSGTSLKWEAMH
jgi:hypothetical protein